MLEIVIVLKDKYVITLFVHLNLNESPFHSSPIINSGSYGNIHLVKAKNESNLCGC